MFGWSYTSPHFHASQHGAVTIVRATGPEIRHPEPASELGAEIWGLVQDKGRKAILLDLANVKYMSSTGFAVLLGLAEKIKTAGGVLKICGLNRDVAIGADIIGLGRHIQTFSDESDARRSFEPTSG